MRVSKDVSDKGFDPHAAKRRVWCRDVEIVNWVTADNFRNVVIDDSGKVHNGAVRIEDLPEDRPQHVQTAPADFPADAGFAGAGLVHVPDAPVSKEPATEEQPAVVEPAVTYQLSMPLEEVQRPGNPDEGAVVTQSERLPDALDLTSNETLEGGNCSTDGTCEACQ